MAGRRGWKISLWVAFACAAFAQAGSAQSSGGQGFGNWRFDRWAGLPPEFRIELDHRTRYEFVSDQFRAGRAGDDDLLAFRTRIRARWQALPWLAAAAAEIDTMRKGRKVLIVAESLTQPQCLCNVAYFNKLKFTNASFCVYVSNTNSKTKHSAIMAISIFPRID